MAVIFVELFSAACSQWPLPYAVQPPLLCSRAWAAAHYGQAALAVREPGREPCSSPSAALHSAEKRDFKVLCVDA